MSKRKSQLKGGRPAKSACSGLDETSSIEDGITEETVRECMRNKEAFYRRFQLSPTILAALEADGVITYEEINKMEADKLTPHDKAKVILERVEKRDVEDFLNLCHTLYRTDHKHIVKSVWKLDIDKIERQRGKQEGEIMPNTGSTQQGNAGSQPANSAPQKASTTAKQPTSGTQAISPVNNDLATKVSKDPGAYYPMHIDDKGICGRAIIINNYTFVENEDFKGATKDEEILKNLLVALHFEVEIWSNLTKEELDNKIKDEQKKQDIHYDCFIMFLLSHGGEKTFVTVEGNEIQIMQDIAKKFDATKFPQLKDKPKLFFIDTCRASKKSQPKTSGSKKKTPKVPSIEPHPMADFMLYYCTFEGDLAFCDDSGSPFIQSLVSVIRKRHSEEHLLEMITRVTNEVDGIAQEYDDDEEKKIRCTQLPQCSSTLKRLLYFEP